GRARAARARGPLRLRRRLGGERRRRDHRRPPRTAAHPRARHARRSPGPPLILGRGKGEQFLASDPGALLAYTRDVVFLENGDLARLTRDRIEIWDRNGAAVERPVQRLNWDPIQAEKGGYKHFMLKEIHEQAQALQDTFAGRVDFETGEISFDTLHVDEETARGLSRLHLLACGTSWHSALIGKFMIEELARVPVEVDY